VNSPALPLSAVVEALLAVAVDAVLSVLPPQPASIVADRAAAAASAVACLIFFMLGFLLLCSAFLSYERGPATEVLWR
jgi:hypothetical protein